MVSFIEAFAIADCQLAWDTVENIEATIDRVRYMSLDHVTPPDMMLPSIMIFSSRWWPATRCS